jgi:hypothetical protein
MLKRVAWWFGGMLYLVLVLPETALAYLDPGAGGLIVQLILGGLTGLLVILKLYWRRLWASVGRLGRGSRNRQPQGDLRK